MLNPEPRYQVGTRLFFSAIGARAYVSQHGGDVYDLHMQRLLPDNAPRVLDPAAVIGRARAVLGFDGLTRGRVDLETLRSRTAALVEHGLSHAEAIEMAKAETLVKL